MKLSTPYIRLVLEVTLAAALIELVIMRVVPLSLPGVSGWREAVADAVLLVLALAPIVWWRSVRAFQRHARQGGHPTLALDAAGSLGLSMIVLTAGSFRIKRIAISGIVIPSGISGRSASARPTLAFRFSGTK